MHYLGPRVGQIPLTSWEQVVEAAEGGLLAESQWCEVKKQPRPRDKPSNVELARDLASLSVHGGVLIYGVEDKTYSVVGCDISGLEDRISQVAAMGIHPPLSPVIYPPIADPHDASKYVLVVVVPASLQAPHMVDGSYWGRSSNGKRTLDDPEVRSLIASRESSDTKFRERLVGMVDHDPLARFISDHPTGNGHVYLLAEPCAPVFGRADDLNLQKVVMTLMGQRHGIGTPSQVRYTTRDPLGPAVSYPNELMEDRKYEDSACYLLCEDDDASLHFVSGGGTMYRERAFRGEDGPTEVVGTAIIIQSTREFLEVVRELSVNHWGFSGEWRVGIHVNNLGGKILSMNTIWRGAETFPRDSFTNQITTSPVTWGESEEPEAARLLTGFLRAIGQDGRNLETVSRL